ncbi:DUF5805 domain-containing protein [Halomicrobium urmianum]|uniref:DUF5805 domain-containing protein n=1 Tax=Halomicrobium urmianum TaxID=1586233 RepID=UPI001CD9BE45|nr:DUF5805 domain-containing protein [Halomicrobium urmianum]
MATEEDVDTSRARVQTYVPAYQKDEWKRHADELDMSLSEFVRSMVQAGRSGFEGIERNETAAQEDADEGRPSGPDPRGERLEDRVLEILSDGEFYEWDALVAALTENVEDRLEETLQDLQSRDEVRYSGRNGGYTIE